jgi:hypothetical protein
VNKTRVCALQVCSVEFDRKDIEMNKLVATCLESSFHVFDMRTQHPTDGFASVSEKVTVKYLALLSIAKPAHAVGKAI